MLILISAQADQTDQVKYPVGYRSWQHIKSMLIEPGHQLAKPFQGIHHIYANELAQQGLHNGIYPEGAVFVFDLLEYHASGNAITEGDRKLIGVMHKDSNKFSATGNWGYEGFAGDSSSQRLTNDGGQSCHGCHITQKENNYIYTQPRK